MFAGPLRTVEELLLRHRAATVFQSLWRGRMGRRAVDTAMSFALFRRFADRCGRTAVFSPLPVFSSSFLVLVPGCPRRFPSDRYSIYKETSMPDFQCLVFRSEELMTGEGGVAVSIGPALRHRKCDELLELCGLRDDDAASGRSRRVDANAFWAFSGLQRTEAIGFESFMAALAHYQGVDSRRREDSAAAGGGRG